MRRLLYLTALSMLVVALTANVALGQSRGPSGADGSYNCPDFDTQAQAQGYYDAQGGLSGGDPDGLDRDQDGEACEDSLPEGSTTTGPTGPEVPQQNPDPCTIPPNGTKGFDGADADCVAEELETPQNTDNGSDVGGTISCDDFVSAAGNPSQFQAQQFYDFQATAAQQAAIDADGDGFACDSLETSVDDLGETDADRTAMQQPATPDNEQPSANQYADDSGEMTSLPDTGGFSPGGLAAGAGALLIAGGLLLRHRLS